MSRPRSLQGETTSLSKALRILRLVAASNSTGVNLAGVARRTGISTTSTHRLLHALEEEGFLSFDPYSKRYFLGPDAATIGSVAGWSEMSEELRQRLQSVLELVADRTGDTAYLTVRKEMSAVCVGKAPGSFMVSANTLDVGARRPLGVGAGSLALLAAETEENAARIINVNREAYDRYGQLTADRVAEAVSAARVEGYAFNDSFIIEGVGAIGVPVLGADRSIVAAISVAAISSRLRETRRREICEIIRDALSDMNLTERRDNLATH